ncbi:MAG: hypothetical protein ACK55Z_21430, partial [bacterium]
MPTGVSPWLWNDRQLFIGRHRNGRLLPKCHEGGRRNAFQKRQMHGSGRTRHRLCDRDCIGPVEGFESAQIDRGLAISEG